VSDRRKNDDLRDAINRLEDVIEQSVRSAERVDRLTGLRNGMALNEHLETLATGNESFWVAFVEVDRFKSLNDRFGHEKADAVLKQVAAMMDAMRGCFPGKTAAYRAHGDEFFYVGQGPEDVVHEGLKSLRGSIASIKIETDLQDKALMQCTVSIGWLSKKDLAGLVTDRVVLDALELAVAKAKRDRDTVVRFTSKLKLENWVALRSDCSECGCRFAFDVKRASVRHGRVWCPNCGHRMDRPPIPPPQKMPASSHDI
jgi:diguanylate cyclase (GGDEF)-like protein